MTKIVTYDWLQEFLSSAKVVRGFRKPLPRVQCVDGFTVSIQVGHALYSSPRSDIGPWVAVELGFPTMEESMLMEYAENSDDPTETVYGYVPVDVVIDVLNKHGGVVT